MPAISPQQFTDRTRETTPLAAVLGDKALTVTEIVPTTGFYDYEAKYGDGGSRHVNRRYISAPKL